MCISVKGRKEETGRDNVREKMNVDNSVLRGSKGLLKCGRERQEEKETCVRSRERERQRKGHGDLNHFDVSLIICCEIIFLTF